MIDENLIYKFELLGFFRISFGFPKKLHSS